MRKHWTYFGNLARHLIIGISSSNQPAPVPRRTLKLWILKILIHDETTPYNSSARVFDIFYFRQQQQELWSLPLRSESQAAGLKQFQMDGGLRPVSQPEFRGTCYDVEERVYLE